MSVFLLLALAVLLFFLAGRYVAPVGEFYGFVFRLLAKPCTALEQYLAAFKSKPDAARPGLSTIVRLLSSAVALFACVSEVYGGIQAAGTLFDVTDTSVAFLPPDLATPALGVTFLCLSLLSGMGYLEAEG